MIWASIFPSGGLVGGWGVKILLQEKNKADVSGGVMSEEIHYRGGMKRVSLWAFPMQRENFPANLVYRISLSKFWQEFWFVRPIQQHMWLFGMLRTATL